MRKVSPGGIVTTVAGNGHQGYAGDGGPATGAQLNGAYGLATDKAGNLFLVDGARVRKISTTGIITTVAGDGSYGFSGDGGPAISAQLNTPAGIAVDSAGIIYIADDGNLRVRRISLNGTISTVVGTGSNRDVLKAKIVRNSLLGNPAPLQNHAPEQLGAAGEYRRFAEMKECLKQVAPGFPAKGTVCQDRFRIGNVLMVEPSNERVRNIDFEVFRIDTSSAV